MSVETPTQEIPQADLDTKVTDEQSPKVESEIEEPAILDELVIEEVNIDGMCGVY